MYSTSSSRASIFLFYRKVVFDYKINWIHFHFATVLILALIVFLAGIETATSNKVRNFMLTLHVNKRRFADYNYM